MNHVSICNASTKHAVLNANSKLVCSTCNDFLFYVCHDIYAVDYLNVCARAKSKRAKKNEWKRIGKVFTHVGHKWLPTGRTFTIDGTKCPLTRITSTIVVPPKETSQTYVITKYPKIKDDLVKYAKMEQSYIDEYKRNLELAAELSKRMIWLKKLFIMNFQTNVQDLKIVIFLLKLKAKSKRAKKNEWKRIALITADTTGTPSSTSIDQDAPFVSTSPTSHETQSPVIPEGVEE
nr:hypothetical protein [Tanacetum cinerariifolium]